jgi:AcrR family transcriptional regulator
VGTFYLYYPTKDALFLELVKETAQALKEEIDQARAQVEDLVEKIRVANLAFFRFARDHREVLKIVFGHGNTFNELLRQVYGGFIMDAAERVAEGAQKKVFRPLPPQVVANALVGMSAQVVSWWIEQDGPSAEEMAETMTGFVLHGLALKPTQRL